MKIKELVKNLSGKRTFNLDNFEVRGIAYDSRRVKENFIFVAVRGSKADGHQFINDATMRGARAIVVSKRSPVLPSDIGEIVVPDTRKALHLLGSWFYGEPSKKIKLAGVTGTNGKTTVSFIIKHILEFTGSRCGLIGTIAYKVGERSISSFNTTPESLDLQELFADMLEEQFPWAVMEVSSHGIDQERIAEVHFDTAVFTNISSHEHIDYHKSFKEYLRAKLEFFNRYLKESVKENKTGIINADDPCAGYFVKALRKNSINCVTFGRKNADIRLLDYSINRGGSCMKVEIEGNSLNFQTSLRGRGNVYNALAAIAFARTHNIPMESVREALQNIASVPGRFESVDEGQKFDVIVDYAHTHNALMNLLESVREMKPRRIILVFGCGGDRDPSKRPLMGRIAVKMADLVFITSDNPRSEDPQDIIGTIEKGIPFYLRHKYVSVPDRKKAIGEAIAIAKEGDCVVIAGKGHETFQILKHTTIPFDDRVQAADAIKKRKS